MIEQIGLLPQKPPLDQRPASSHQSKGCKLVFKNIVIEIDKKDVLKDVGGVALPGEMLAIMGPSGAGKTTLLNCLAGRRPLDNGTITLNSQPINKQLRRQISYVLQEDTFLPELTCWETIWYTAQLRLPGSMVVSEKKALVDEIIDALDMRKCLRTKIGSNVKRGLSGGEKKRTNIACELLTNPALMLLDEPTSGLDSATAYSLIAKLKQLAKNSSKTVVMTIHQPSSQIFHMFDKLLLLCDGQVAYFGDVKHCANFFSSISLPCPQTYNLADFILDQVKDTDEVKRKIIDRARLQRFEQWYPEELKLRSLAVTYVDEVAMTDESKRVDDDKTGQISNSLLSDVVPNDTQPLYPPEELQYALCDGKVRSEACVENGKKSSNMDVSYANSDDEAESKWPTSFWLQYSVLTRRSFFQCWPRVISKEQLFQTLVSSIFAGLLWFRTKPEEESLSDRRGVIFFPVVYGVFNAMLASINSVPVERPVINKERLGGYYRLSAYYMAKLTSELPLVLIMPAVFFSVIFWLAGLSYNFGVFVQMLGLALLSATIGQSLGLFFGSLVLDFTQALTCTVTIILCLNFAGGFFISNMPVWAEWIKYVSFISLSYYAAVEIDMTHTNIRCSQSGSRFVACQKAALSANSSDIIYIPQKDLVDELTLSDEGWLLYHYVLILVSMIVVPTICTYIVMRFIRKPQSS